MRFSILGLAACMLVAGGPARASSGGIAGFTGNPSINNGMDCNTCHTGGVAPEVTLLGPTFVQPGTTHTYTLTMSGGQEAFGGFGVSVTAGGLQPVEPGTQWMNAEVVHTAPRPAVGGTVSWTFNWRAPVVLGPATFYAAGNSVNGTQGDNGDLGGTETLSVMVTNQIPGVGETSGPGLAPLIVTGYDEGSGNLSLSYQSACQATDNNIYYGPLDQVGVHSWMWEDCAVGTGGTYSSFAPGAGSYFFVIVGTRGAEEGSYGKTSQPAERPPYEANTCGPVQNLANSCD